MLNIENIQELLNDPIRMMEIKDIKISKNFIFILNNKGKLFVCGDNSNGLIGNPNKIQTKTLIQIKGIPSISKISCGKDFILALDIYDSVWGWGNTSKGQLGFLNKKIINVPTQLDIKNLKIKDIAAGNEFSFLVDLKGKIYSSGNNSFGELGLGHNKPIFEFTKVDNVFGIEKVCCGSNHVFLLSKHKKVFGCGRNNFGQLGLYDKNNRNIFIEIEKVFNVKDINLGKNHSTILREDGFLLTTGLNNLGQLGLGDTRNREIFVKIKNLTSIKEFKINNNYTLAIKNNGEIFSWGFNDLMKFTLKDECFISKPTKLIKK